MYAQPKRSRPRINTTISARTFAILVQVAKDIALPNPGVTMDYIINDWVALRGAATVDEGGRGGHGWNTDEQGRTRTVEERTG